MECGIDQKDRKMHNVLIFHNIARKDILQEDNHYHLRQNLEIVFIVNKKMKYLMASHLIQKLNVLLSLKIFNA
jgi:hypothetical protein